MASSTSIRPSTPNKHLPRAYIWNIPSNIFVLVLQVRLASSLGVQAHPRQLPADPSALVTGSCVVLPQFAML